jgi:hypothetical protein
VLGGIFFRGSFEFELEFLNFLDFELFLALLFHFFLVYRFLRHLLALRFFLLDDLLEFFSWLLVF